MVVRILMALAAVLVVPPSALSQVDLTDVGLADHSAPALLGLRVGNGGRPFAGDHRLLSTVTPNGDGLRDRMVVRLRPSEPITLRLEVWATRKTLARRWLSHTVQLGTGGQAIVWQPPAHMPVGTYIVRLTAIDRAGNVRRYGAPTPALLHAYPRAPVIRIRGVDAGFLARSYPVGTAATLRVATDARRLDVQIFRVGAGPGARRLDELTGEAVSGIRSIDWSRRRSAPAPIAVRVGGWPSGVYFARLTADDGRVGFAPFIVRPRASDPHRIAVVVATNTWQAYNFQDVNGDGWGDTWYASALFDTVNMRRPYLHRGVPGPLRVYAAHFLRWMEGNGRQADVLSDDDLARFSSGDALKRRYDLVVFPDHEEYVTPHVYDVVRRYRNLGGNLAFLSANNFFWRVLRNGDGITRARLWRDLGRPESALVGVQFFAYKVRNERPYVAVAPNNFPWLFAGTGIRTGDRFGRGGFEFDRRTVASPRGTRLIAVLPGITASPGEMTFYRTRAGAKVFAAGTISFVRSAHNERVSQILQNLWNRLRLP